MVEASKPVERAVPIKHIALLRLSAVGDVVLMVPTIKALVKHFTDAKVTWIISPPAHQLVQSLPGVTLMVVKKPRSLLDYLKFWRQIRRQRFDVLLAAQASLRANLMIWGIRAKQKIGFDRQRARDGQRCFVNRSIDFADEHLAESFMRFATTLGVPFPRYFDFAFALSPSDEQWFTARSLPADYLAINPMASKAERNWPLDRYVALIQTIAETYPSLTIILTGGPADRPLTEAISQHHPQVKNLAGSTSLCQLAVLLRHAKALIAPDTGPAHIANAMQTPVVGLYAVAPAKLSGPYHYRQSTIDKFPQAAAKFLGKEVAQLAWGTRVHHPQAMSLITVAEVMDILKSVLRV